MISSTRLKSFLYINFFFLMQHLFHVNDKLHKLSYKNTCDILKILEQVSSSEKLTNFCNFMSRGGKSLKIDIMKKLPITNQLSWPRWFSFHLSRGRPGFNSRRSHGLIFINCIKIDICGSQLSHRYLSASP